MGNRISAMISDTIYQYQNTINKEINDIKSLLEKSQDTIDGKEHKLINDKIRIKIQNVKNLIKTLKVEVRINNTSNKEEKEKVKHDINMYVIEIDSLEKKALLFNGCSSSTTKKPVSQSLNDKGITDNATALQEIHNIQKNTDNALDNIINMAQSAQDVGMGTLDELRRQGKQLEDIDKDVDALDENVEKGHKTLSSLRRWNFMFRFKDKEGRN